MKESKRTISLNVLLLSLLLGYSNFTKAQLLTDREEIIKEYGTNYKTGVTDGQKVNYISYLKEIQRDSNGTFDQLKVMYFINLNGKEVCNFWRVLEPASQTNFNVKYYKANFVELEPMKWKDYERKIIYTMEVKDGICVILASLDLENK
jgi:hypothetical protein